mgnify:CR=1 FL=1
MNLIRAAFIFLLIFTFGSCDYVDPRYFREGNEVLVSVSQWAIDTSFLTKDSSQSQMVLIEEYTGQNCGNCALFQGKASDASGGCPLFAGKKVSTKGWCSAYNKKA